MANKHKQPKLTDPEFLEYIRNKRCLCVSCADLKKRVVEHGLEEIDKYDGMICGGVEDMFIRRGRW